MTFQDNAWLRAEGCNVAKSVWRRNPWHYVHIISPVFQHLFHQSDADKRWVMELWPNWMFLLTLRLGHCSLTSARNVKLIAGDFIEEGLGQVVTVAVLRHKMCFHIHSLIHIFETSPPSEAVARHVALILSLFIFDLAQLMETRLCFKFAFNLMVTQKGTKIRIKILSCKHISQKILIWIQFHSEWGGGVGLCQLVVWSVPVYTLVLIVSSRQTCAWQTPALVIAGTGENMAGAQHKWHNFFVEDFKRGRGEISLGVRWQQCLFRTQAQAQELKLPLFPEKKRTSQNGLLSFNI